MPRGRWPRSAGCGSGVPRPGLARRDPRALRYALLLSLLACLFIANIDAPGRLYAAVTPSLPVAPGAPATELQAWITPPAYTRIAPIFLKPEGGTRVGSGGFASDGQRLGRRRRSRP